MGDLTAHFSRHEFRCRGDNCCGGSAPISLELVDALQALRDRMNEIAREMGPQRRPAGEVKLVVSSGFRCLTHNCKPKSEGGVGSEPTSQHPRGLAADILVPEGFSCDELAAEAEGFEEFAFGGIGTYPTPREGAPRGFVHLDVRGNGPARWNEDDPRQGNPDPDGDDENK